ncbi:MAG: preprotein translocase subunit SecE [Armatimonadota bacterium]|nr:preprotein translocase subunit SecE [Armatimonadota bacterium]MDR7520650.1 preprotein translocase subunit SecE [Armatimonadota bacterium]MDR7550396.1 preprotein translocase subunit SecE [Armatimonadota bacterium]
MARTTEVKVAPRSARVVATRRLPAFVERIVTYLREVWVELNRVDWPSRRELVSATIVVILVLTVVSLYLGLFDYIYTVALKRLLLPTAR